MGLLDDIKNASADEIAAVRALFGTTATPEAPAPVSPEPAPAEYWVHLADGRVLQSGDSASTHIDGSAVIGRYPMSDTEKEAATK